MKCCVSFLKIARIGDDKTQGSSGAAPALGDQSTEPIPCNMRVETRAKHPGPAEYDPYRPFDKRYAGRLLMRCNAQSDRGQQFQLEAAQRRWDRRPSFQTNELQRRADAIQPN